MKLIPPGFLGRGGMVLPQAWILLALSGPAAHGISLADLDRFPPREVVRAYRDLAAYHSQWLDGRVAAVRPWTNTMTGLVDGGNHKFCGNQWEAARACRVARTWLKEYHAWREDQASRYLAWNALANAHGCGSSSGLNGGKPAPADILHDLRELRKCIGAHAYADGRMPCPVPLERFALLP